MLRARWHAGAPPDAAEVQFHGPIKNPYLYHPKGAETLVAAKVKSEWLIPILGTRAGAVAGYTGPLRALDTAMADRLLTSLEAAPSWQQAMAGLSENLGQWCHDKGLDGRQKKFGLVQAAALLARRAKGRSGPESWPGRSGFPNGICFAAFRTRWALRQRKFPGVCGF